MPLQLQENMSLQINIGFVVVLALAGCQKPPDLRPFQANIQAGCLPYEPGSVTLTGSVRQVMAYGPPNFGESPKTDAKEPFLALVLDRSICVRGDPTDHDPEDDVREMQIAFLNMPFDRTIRGRKIRIVGTLLHAETGHHHTKVIISPTRVDRL